MQKVNHNIFNIIIFFLCLFPNLLVIPRHAESIDSSFFWSLPYAASHQLQWGVSYLSTYGPLGFLNQPNYLGAYYGWVASMLFSLSTRALFIYVSLLFISKKQESFLEFELRKWEFFVYCLGFYIFGCFCDSQWMLLICIYGLLIQALKIKPSFTKLALIALCVSICTQIKATDILGIGVVLIIYFGFLIKSRKNILDGFLLCLGITALWLMIWVAMGQAIANIPAYFYGTYQIVIGYSSAVALEGPGYMICAALILIFLFAITAIKNYSVNRVSLSYFTLYAPLLYLSWKEAFIRADLGHIICFYLTILYINWTCYQLIKSLPKSSLWILRIGCYVSIAFILLIATKTSSFWQPWKTFSTLDQVGRLITSNYQENQKNIFKSLREKKPLPNYLAQSLQPVPTAIIPYQALFAPTYDVPLALPPIPQLYIAYTSYLDNMEADWLVKNQPKQIIYCFQGFDGQYPLFNSPLFLFEVFNHYSLVKKEENLALLIRKAPSDRIIKWENAVSYGVFNKEISLPKTDSSSLVFLKVKIEPSLFGKIIGLLYKNDSVSITFHLIDGTQRNYPFNYNIGHDALLVSNHVQSMDEYALLSSGKSLKNVRSISFNLESHKKWEYEQTFPFQFGSTEYF